MRFYRPIPAPRDARAFAAAALAAVALVLVTVLPAFAAPTPVRLIDPSVSPRAVSAGAPVTFEITYKSPNGIAAASVMVGFGGETYALEPVAGKQNVHAGFRYRVTVTPPVGSGPVTFLAEDELGGVATATAGTLEVTAVPSSTSNGGAGSSSSSSSSGSGGTASGSTGSGGSSSSSGSAGSSGSSSSSGSAGSSSGSGSAGAPGPGSPGSAPASSSGSSSSAGGSSSGDTGSGRAASAPAPPAGSGGDAGAGSAPAAVPSTGPGMAGAPVAVVVTATRAIRPAPHTAIAQGSTPTGPAGGLEAPVDRSAVGAGAASSRGAVDGAPGAVGALAGIGALGGAPDPFAAVLPVLATTFGGVAMVMAFGLFGKRRQDGSPTDSDEALAAAAASGVGAVASGALVGTAPDPLAPAPAPVPVDAEMAMPRWRRPSLLEARKADPLRSAAAPDVKLTFEHGLVDPVAGHERRRIRYRVVRLLDGPDELTASDVGVLDAGDEVQLLERSGVYWFVLCPNGQQGWVHKMVLGEVVEEPNLPGPAARATGPRQTGDGALAARLATIDPVAASGAADPAGHDPTMPGPAWTLHGGATSDARDDVDDDALLAFLAARGRG